MSFESSFLFSSNQTIQFKRFSSRIVVDATVNFVLSVGISCYAQLYIIDVPHTFVLLIALLSTSDPPHASGSLLSSCVNRFMIKRL